jgi:hypothetical protein
MNERIDDLARLAKTLAEKDINMKISYNEQLKVFAEKFAELIVKDCLAVIGKDRRAQLDKGDLGTARVIQLGAISVIKHFGIKE